ncbi:MAG TPA: hypothetical protein VN026_10885 [Bacteroidia bacterium]|jgi:hypothetical protein|nr:hypothetical protein [Bacteroidia bacterium]
MDNNYITKSDLLIDKLEGTVDLVQTKNKRLESEMEKKDNALENVNEKLESAKSEIIKLNTTNQLVTQKNSELSIEKEKIISDTKEKIENLENEIGELHQLIFDVRETIIKDPNLLLYYGQKADSIMNVSFGEGKTIFDLDYLKEKQFPLPLLLELEDQEFGIQTTNYTLLRDNDKYKLSKINNNSNGERAQAQVN